MGIVIVVVVVVLVVAVALVVRRAAARARARIDAALGDLEVLRKEKVTFYGLASKGAGQVRGLGTLALTPDALVFLQLVPAVEVRVPRAAITHLEVTQSFLGRTEGRDLLVVEWMTEDDPPGQDRVAFDVQELDSWRAALSD